jgi:hypothetical protein
MIDIESIKTREQAATKGPWETQSLGENYFRCFGEGMENRPAWIVPHALQLSDGECPAMLWADAEFIAHAREDIPNLLGRIEEVESENERLRAELAKHQESQFHPDWSMLKATRDSLKECRAEVGRLQSKLDHKCELLGE